MIKVSFFIKPVHAGQVIILLDKIAIDLAMTPVKVAPTKRGDRITTALQVLSKMDMPFTPPELSKAMSAEGTELKNVHAFMKSLVMKDVVKRLASGKYRTK